MDAFELVVLQERWAKAVTKLRAGHPKKALVLGSVLDTEPEGDALASTVDTLETMLTGKPEVPTVAPQPETTKKAPGGQSTAARGRRLKGRLADSGTQAARPPAPQDSNGLTAVIDSGIPPLIGHNATLAWLCLLRHAQGREARRVLKISYATIRKGTGLSDFGVRDGIRALLDKHGPRIIWKMAEGSRRAGRGGNPHEMTPEYMVPYPTQGDLRRWRNKLVEMHKKEAAAALPATP
jgi:hypothetical protein